MASIDKAAIGFSIAIVVIGVAFAMYGDAAQNAGPSVSTPTITKTVEPVMEEKMKPLKSGYERATSDTDPGLGHESHQLAVLLAPSDMHLEDQSELMKNQQRLGLQTVKQSLN
jgi:hypothetical protein